jgi:hypothetical protein
LEHHPAAAINRGNVEMFRKSRLVGIGRSGTKVADFGPWADVLNERKPAHNEHQDHDKDLIPGIADVMLYPTSDAVERI